MRLKKGVSLKGISPEMAIAAQVVESVYRMYLVEGIDCTITSGVEGKHMQGSLHYLGYALDFRTRDVVEGSKNGLLWDVKAALGPEFDVVLETDHLHVEFDPPDPLIN